MDGEGAFPAVSLTQRLVEGGADEDAPAFGHGGLRRRQGGFWGRPALGLSVLLAPFHTQIQGAVFVHLYGHVLRTKMSDREQRRFRTRCKQKHAKTWIKIEGIA